MEGRISQVHGLELLEYSREKVYGMEGRICQVHGLEHKEGFQHLARTCADWHPILYVPQFSVNQSNVYTEFIKILEINMKDINMIQTKYSLNVYNCIVTMF